MSKSDYLSRFAHFLSKRFSICSSSTSTQQVFLIQIQLHIKTIHLFQLFFQSFLKDKMLFHLDFYGFKLCDSFRQMVFVASNRV